MRAPFIRSILSTLVLLFIARTGSAFDQIDLATLGTPKTIATRVYGSTGDGSSGLPIAGGFDMDGDGFRDTAMAAFQATNPSGDLLAGEVALIFGDGTIGGSIDTAGFSPDILKIAGAGPSETTGSEIWMDDVTGDGIGDLLIARQNFTTPGRIGAGALTILVGGPALRTFAAGLQHLELATPPASLTLTTFIGPVSLGRLGIWVRTGDVTGDGISDIVVGADQVASTATHSGEVYVIRGGAHLAINQTIDLIGFGTTALAGHIARITPPPGSSHFHFGATCQIGDLDGNGRSEVFVAAALNRAGASIPADGAGAGSADGVGGSTDGTLYIAWDDNFVDPWPAGLSFAIDTSPGSHTIIEGQNCNVSFGEEILAGADYDANGQADLFVGDIVGNCAMQSRVFAGSGHVFFDAASLKGLTFDLETPPPGLLRTDIFGGAPGDLASDTAMQGDFDGDGAADLAIGSPHASPFGRTNAGLVHVFFGRSGGWPAQIDLQSASSLPETTLRITELDGANGTVGSDKGDTLCYSGTAGDLDGDGRDDLILNEMVGNGLQPGTIDVGNQIVVSGRALGPPKVPGLAFWGVLVTCFFSLCIGLGRAKGARGADSSGHLSMS
ncbi:MAG TPA: hypothetical protein ENI85_15305 [Deltaproteobacteria bacterium]|nr:hypothetical protein [Deltaproteobacteria bacterium]